MTLLHALILGIVEGITEFLPISSTGHMILTSNLLGIPKADFVKSFEIIIQLGAILAVVVLYARMLLKNWNLVKKVVVGFIPTGILGLIFYKIVKTYLLDNSTVVAWSLILGGVAIIALEYAHAKLPRFRNESKSISYTQAGVSGVFQSLAMIPGVSRSAATIMGGLFMGISRETITEFSFLLAVPTMAAATFLDVVKNASLFSFGNWEVLLTGFVTAFIVAIFAIKFLLKFIKTHTFTAFGVYRIIVGVLFLLFFVH